MNNLNRKNTIGRFAPSALMLAVLGVTFPATLAFSRRVFPDDLLRQIALLVVTEVAFIAWHVASSNFARGERQHSIAGSMTWVSLAGVVAMAAVEISIEFMTQGLIERSRVFGSIGLIVLITLLAAHLVASVAYSQSDPDRMRREVAERADAHIHSTILDSMMREAENLAPEVAAQRAAAYAERLRRQHAITSIAEFDSVRVHTPATQLHGGIEAGRGSIFDKSAPIVKMQADDTETETDFGEDRQYPK
jgi:hypothetical protein